MTDKYKHISGIIYSFIDIWNIGQLDNIGKDLIYIENLFADKKIDPSIFGIKRKFIPRIDSNRLIFDN